MKLLFLSIITLFFLPHVWAAPLTVPKAFTANAPAVAADVNANFNAVKAAVNDNDSRVNTNSTNIGSNAVAITSKGLLGVTVLNPPCPAAPLAAAPATVFTKVGSLGTFNKISATSTIEATFHGRVSAATISGTGIVFELRVNNVASTKGKARTVLKAAEVGANGIQVSMTGIFTGLAIGGHSVDMYVGGFSPATNIMWDSGCWTADHVVIKELE